MKTIIFSDLDGTLLDHKTYSYQKAKPALELIKKTKTPLIICTSKTGAEIKDFRKQMKNKDPFISENGGGIFIPKKYFDFKFKYDKEKKGYFIIELGADYSRLRRIFNKIKKKYNVVGFGDLSAKEVAKDTGLTLKQAKLAVKREYDEPFRILNEKDKSKIISEIKKNKLKYTKGGRYWHLIGKNDKGKAVKIISRLFKKKFKKIKTIGIGDSENDFAMLDSVNKGFLVQRPNKRYTSKKYIKAKGIGPIGWKEVILNELCSEEKS